MNLHSSSGVRHFSIDPSRAMAIQDSIPSSGIPELEVDAVTVNLHYNSLNVLIYVYHVEIMDIIICWYQMTAESVSELFTKLLSRKNGKSS
jgi:hypothetical protein